MCSSAAGGVAGGVPSPSRSLEAMRSRENRLCTRGCGGCASMQPLRSLQGRRRRPPSAARSRRRASTTAGCWRRGRASVQGPCTRQHPFVCSLCGACICSMWHGACACLQPHPRGTWHPCKLVCTQHSMHLEGARTGGRSAPGRSAASIFTAALLPASAASSSLPINT